MSEKEPNGTEFDEIAKHLPDVAMQYEAFESFRVQFQKTYEELLLALRSANDRPDAVAMFIHDALKARTQNTTTIAGITGYKEWQLTHPIWETDNGFGGVRYKRADDYEVCQIACTPLLYGYMERFANPLNPCHDIRISHRVGANHSQVYVDDEELAISGNAPKDRRHIKTLAAVTASLELAEWTVIQQHDSAN